MLHPLLHLLATQPQLLAGHVEAYAELAAAEFGAASTVWKRRAMFNAAALGCLGVAAVLAGVALMLWAVVPSPEAAWVLLVVPLLPLAMAAICLMLARAPAKAGGFEALRQQIQADMLMLREVSQQ